jgi:hypothetical protein
MDRRDESVFYQEATFFTAQEVCNYLAEAGFGNFSATQTLIPGKPQDTIQDGFGSGAFVAIKGAKPA